MTHISVIIPVYNAADTLPRCLNSVFAQTLAPYEIIAINDGSTDNSLTLLNTYANQHPQLHIISQTNQGVSSTRNTGIEVATGDWLLFLDADDYLAPMTLETLEKGLDGEISLAGLTIHTSAKTYNQSLYQKTESPVPDGSLTIDQALSVFSYYTFCGPVCKLFRADIIRCHSIRFPADMHFGEDTVFVYSYLQYVKQLTVHNAHLYHCDKSNQHSLTATVNSASQLNSIRRIYPAMKELYLSKHLPLNYVDYIYLDALQTATHQSYLDHGLNSDERIRIYKSMFANEHFAAFKSQCSPVLIFLGRIHAWRLSDLYLRLRTIASQR